jgi:hypothetical protein
MKDLHIPFDKDGNMLNWANLDYPDIDPSPDRFSHSVCAWRDNTPFHDTLRINRLERGRSATKFIFISETTKIEYTMFGQWLVDALLAGGMGHGRITGWWDFSKRGANYSIHYLGPQRPASVS